MINVQVIQSTDPHADQLEKLRQYASVPNDQRDALLMSCLKKALLTIQAHTDTALLHCTIRMMVPDVKNGESFRLYQGGRRVVSVKDQDGNEPRFSQDEDRITIKQACQRIIVEYQNEVLPAEALKLEPTAWQYATALYDGEDAATLADILKQTYGCR